MAISQEELEALDNLDLYEYDPTLDTNMVHCELTGSPTRDDSPNQVVEYTHDGRELPMNSIFNYA